MIIKNIGLLVGIVPAGVLRKEGAAMAETGILHDAWLRIENGRIADFGVARGEGRSSVGSADVSTPGLGQGEGPDGDKFPQGTQEPLGGAEANEESGVPLNRQPSGAEAGFSVSTRAFSTTFTPVSRSWRSSVRTICIASCERGNTQPSGCVTSATPSASNQRIVSSCEKALSARFIS